MCFRNTYSGGCFEYQWLLLPAFTSPLPSLCSGLRTHKTMAAAYISVQNGLVASCRIFHKPLIDLAVLVCCWRVHAIRGSCDGGADSRVGRIQPRLALILNGPQVLHQQGKETERQYTDAHSKKHFALPERRWLVLLIILGATKMHIGNRSMHTTEGPWNHTTRDPHSPAESGDSTPQVHYQTLE